MPDSPIHLPWEEADWLLRATAWIHTQLEKQGMRPAGDLEILHQRAWSTFARVLTDNGVVYFKAPAPPDRFEAALTAALERLRPDITAPVLAVDPEQGWLLTSDAGRTLRSIDRGRGQIKHWLKLLPIYAEFQLQMAGRVPEFLAIGVPDRRLEVLPDLFSELLDHSDNLRVGRDPGLTKAEHRRLLALKPGFEVDCTQLAGFDLPETLTHEEVTEVNVLASDGRYIFTDWSEGSISHPFFSMLTTLRTFIYWTGLDENGPELARVRDAYLEPWTEIRTRKEINTAMKLAYRLAMVNRALAWDQGTGRLAEKHKEPYADSVPGWLQDYLEARE